MQISPLVPLSILTLVLAIRTEVSKFAHYHKTGPKHVQNLFWKSAISITYNPPCKWAFGLMAMPLVHRLALSYLTVKAYPLKSAVVMIPWGSQDHYVL